MTSVTNQNKEKQDIWIESEPIEFKHQCEVQFITTHDLGLLIDEFFEAILVDFYGCTILPKMGIIERNVMGIEFNIYLTKNQKNPDDNRISSLIDLEREVDQEDELIGKIRRLNNRSVSKVYAINDDSKSLFKSLAYNNNWNESMAVQTTDNLKSGANILCMEILNIDLIKVLQKMFGSKVNGKHYTYRISPAKHIAGTNFLLKIEKFDQNSLNSVYEKIGFQQPDVGRLPIIRR